MKKASVLIAILIVLMIGIINAPISAQGILGVEGIAVSTGSATTYYNETFNTANTYSSATSYLFWYPTLNGIRIPERKFYEILDTPEYIKIADAEFFRIQGAKDINAVLWVTTGLGFGIGSSVMLGGLTDINNTTGYLIGGGVVALLSLIPILFLQDTETRNIVSYGFARELANTYNRR